MKKLIVNRVRCKKCIDIIESKHIYDFKYCRCGSIGIDGGTEYQKVIWGMNSSEGIKKVEEYLDFSYTIFD